MTNKVTVQIPDNSYDIAIDKGAINYLGAFLEEKKYSKIIVISDNNVAGNYLQKVESILNSNISIIVDVGESSKSFKTLENVCEKVLQAGIDRNSLIVALGGGVVGDLSGFVASVLLRGIDFIQIPTTLLAMVDSSVGGKTAINSKFGKNLIGSFYQPKLVICDLDFLETLPKRQFLCGYAEVIKYGLIFDKKFFDFLQQNHDEIFDFNSEILQKIIHRSCEIKAEIVSKDEKEKGLRAILNFGHTFGHIFETETGYSDELYHGEAVALGMAMAAKASCEKSLINKHDVEKITNYLVKCGFKISAKELRNSWNIENLVSHLFKDKKTINNQLTFILLQEIGKAVIKKDLVVDDVKKIILS